MFGHEFPYISYVTPREDSMLVKTARGAIDKFMQVAKRDHLANTHEFSGEKTPSPRRRNLSIGMIIFIQSKNNHAYTQL